ncbi:MULTISPECIES: TIGR03086 family metal-binding protein [unclassified Streptomyces]|uniref:TIGR03086 family metal-binding protein n=1 Tax=unclassified Streptomyces TaxID=2593676 RepID=UPI00081D6FF0|nr:MULTISPECIES: TIGR03086 family metal-binding protein [unclassified Streptomyces]MYZ39845.1 TIGR03086 family protein [Streptomyces sp. SID4917]SCG05483.1 TIGR03086 family protein [Streptomyces sp. MnatMP-M17]
MDIRALHEEALRSTHRFVAAVGPDQWESPTPCEAWNVRQLVNHLVSGNLWVDELGRGRTIEEVGTDLDGDLLGDDPVAAHQASVSAAAGAFAADGAMERLWPLSYGARPGRVYARQRFIDVLIHGWDIGRATGEDPRLPADLVQECTDLITARPGIRAQWGFADVTAGPGADPQARLLALTGRRS